MFAVVFKMHFFAFHDTLKTFVLNAELENPISFSNAIITSLTKHFISRV